MVNRPPGRAGARTASAGNSAGARGAILLAVAAVLGIVLLQAFDTDGGSGVGVDVGSTTLPPGGSSTDSTLPPTNTVPTTPLTRTPSEVTVLVANGTGIKGLGSTNADTLKALSYNTLTAVDATKALDATTIQFADGYEAEARAIALTLGLPVTAVQPLNSPPVPDTQGANVFVLLGGVAVATSTTLA